MIRERYGTQRDLDFRVWDKRNKKMKEAVETEIDTDKMFGEMIASPQFILMEATDVYDVNNKLIYEGDIVQIPDEEEYYHAGEIREVYFKQGAFRLKPYRLYLGKGYHVEDDASLILLGNVYQNPELLEDRYDKYEADQLEVQREAMGVDRAMVPNNVVDFDSMSPKAFKDANGDLDVSIEGPDIGPAKDIAEIKAQDRRASNAFFDFMHFQHTKGKDKEKGN